MSNYEANPVGFLYERYQSSGVSPLYEVVMSRGQAHAPIFTAKLTVPQGHVVTATGSSKKIAKNLAAKMMLDKLEEVEGQSKLVQNTKKKIINVNDNYVKSPPALSTYTEEEDESSSSQVLQSHQENVKILKKEEQGGNAEENEGENFDIEGLVEKLSLETALDPKKHSMAEVVFSMMKRGGEKLKKLQSTDIVGSGYQLDCCSLLGEVAAEHNLNLTYREVLGPHGEHERGLGQVQVSALGRSRPCDLICLGEGADPGQARQVAARTALIYLKTLTG